MAKNIAHERNKAAKTPHVSGDAPQHRGGDHIRKAQNWGGGNKAGKGSTSDSMGRKAALQSTALELKREQADVLSCFERNREIVELPEGLETGRTRARPRGARADADCIDRARHHSHRCHQLRGAAGVDMAILAA